ncbi:hypothetical protein [Methylobacterium sp. WL116]|uniref:hypothetical protein n=1 Tax=Methylobacterium sp. WL116 TaxID=2603889 RepID=UPI0011C8B458|nr:hypothetical protein [Methylobacterium sp. WL116]TXM95365.1 hypothetical protein FV223_01020 [Methylobacterium sp. WL116]
MILPPLSGDAMLRSDPAFSIRRFMLTGIALLGIGNGVTTTALATPQGVAALEGYACAQVDPELFTRQAWSERDAPYGIPFIEWDRTTFEALKRRMTACATDANRRRTVMMLRYIDDQPYGRQAQVTGQVETLRAKQTVAVDREVELREAVRVAESDPDLLSRRNRVADIDRRLARGGIPSALELDLRARLDPIRSAIAEQDAKNAAASAAALAQQRTEAASRAEEQRKLALQQAAQRQADAQRQEAAAQRQQAEIEAREEAERVKADQAYAQKASSLPAPVRSFLEKNPQFKLVTAREDLLQLLTVLDAVGYDLDTCRGSLEGYQSDWTESQRRYGLVQQVLLSYHGVTAADLAAGAKERRQAWATSGAADSLRANIILMRRACAQALNLSTGVADFTR